METLKTKVYLSGEPLGRVVYLVGADMKDDIFSLLPDPKPHLVVTEVADWNRELSPWKAERAFKGGDDFAGRADEYLERLTETIRMIEIEYQMAIKKRYIAGYSLAGLFAVYSLYRTDIFSGAASMSGSFWFDDFTDLMKREKPLRMPDRMYFSLGDRERKTKNARMATVYDRTLEAKALLPCENSVFKSEAGGHFKDIPDRIARGISYITEI